MPRFAANLSTMYPELPFLDRFGACARDGFSAVEVQFPYGVAADDIAGELRRHGLQMVLFNTESGDFAAGERGTAWLPGREAEFLAGVDRAIEYARVLDCPRLHALAGIAPAGADRARLRSTAVANLREAARRCARVGITLLIEPINPRDMPGYLLNTQADARALLAEVGAPNLRIQMDLYHCQIVEGDLATRIRSGFAAIGHVQVAGVPDRHEPDEGEVNYPFLFDLLDRLGYQGWIGCEYRPRAGTSAGLGWVRPYLSQ